MIAFNFYGTHGLGCERMRFVRVHSDLWQRVLKWGFFYWPVGKKLQEHDSNYFKI